MSCCNQQGAQCTDVAQGDRAFGQTDPTGITPRAEMAVDAFADQSGHRAEFALRERQPDLRPLRGWTRVQRSKFDQRLGEANRRGQLQIFGDLRRRLAQPLAEQANDGQHRLRCAEQFTGERASVDRQQGAGGERRRGGGTRPLVQHRDLANHVAGFGEIEHHLAAAQHRHRQFHISLDDHQDGAAGIALAKNLVTLGIGEQAGTPDQRAKGLDGNEAHDLVRLE